jgi:hypothetical protein
MRCPRPAHTPGPGPEHTETTPARLLVGWDEIAAYARKRPETLRSYRRTMAFPAVRWGRHVVSSPDMIHSWLLAIDQQRRRRRLALASQAPPKA